MTTNTNILSKGKWVLHTVLVVFLSGCGTYGEPLFLAKMYDSADRCQRNPHIHYCGASGSRTVIYATPNGAPVGTAVGYVKK
jgi:hypothetical protein